MESVSKRTMSNQNTGNTVQQVESEFTPGVEIKIIVAVIFLMAFGLVMIFSASSYTSSISSATNYDSAFYFKKQLKMIILGMVAAGAVSVIPYKAFKKVGPLMYATKVCMIIFMAYYVSKYWKEMHKFLRIFKLWLFIAFQAGLILAISSNLSSCLILLLMVFVLTFIVGKNPSLHIGVGVFGIVAVIILIIWLKATMPLESEMDKYPYQIQRFFGWIDPERYAGSLGYQPLQSLYAIGSGGLLGKGLGNGTQKLSNIPEAQNDMIFAIICEELGLVGAIIMFLMFGYLLYQMFIVVRESKNLYGSVVVIGVMLHIIFQIIVNVCVAVNFFPNTGVSLPFISSGGSAILCTMIEIGLVLGIRRQQCNRKYSRIN